MTTITLPRPPSTNGLYKNIARGRARTKAYDKWIREAGQQIILQNPAPVTGPVRLFLSVEKRGKVREDIDNRIKACADLLVKHEIIDDDRNVQSVWAEWSHDVEGCRVTIERVRND